MLLQLFERPFLGKKKRKEEHYILKIYIYFLLVDKSENQPGHKVISNNLYV